MFSKSTYYMFSLVSKMKWLLHHNTPVIHFDVLAPESARAHNSRNKETAKVG